MLEKMTDSGDDEIFGDDDDEVGELGKSFLSASNYVRGVVDRLDQDSLLYLYARYKLATEGKCNTPKPGFFDFQGKKKWEAWKGLGDLSKEDAMEQYIQRLVKADVGFKVGEKSANNSSSWNRVSRPCQDEPVTSGPSSSLLEIVKSCNAQDIQQCLSRNPEEITVPDEDGMTPLHWACDRGETSIVEVLLKHGANPNQRAADGQTPLHFAASCEHSSVVTVLLSSGGDPNIEDNEGVRPCMATDSSAIRSLFS